MTLVIAWLVSNWKLVVGAALLALLAGFAAAVKVQTARLNAAKGHLAACTADVATWQGAVQARDAAIGTLKVKLAAQEAAISDLRQAGEAAAARLAAARAENARLGTEVADLSKPLPPGCDAKLRETVSRLKAMYQKAKVAP